MIRANFLRRFDFDGDYVDPTTIDIQGSWKINYISSTFLNGWINYVEPVRVVVLARKT